MPVTYPYPSKQTNKPTQEEIQFSPEGVQVKRGSLTFKADGLDKLSNRERSQMGIEIAQGPPISAPLIVLAVLGIRGKKIMGEVPLKYSRLYIIVMMSLCG